MKDYFQSPIACEDALRVLFYKRAELVGDPSKCDADMIRGNLDRVRELNGEEMIEVITRIAPVFSRALVR